MSNTRITQQHGTDFPEFRVDVQFIEGSAGEELQNNLVSTVRSLLRWASRETSDGTASNREAA